jgi:hypothetical protein
MRNFTTFVFYLILGFFFFGGSSVASSTLRRNPFLQPPLFVCVKGKGGGGFIAETLSLADLL